MRDIRIFLFSNQPVVRYKRSYYSRMKNFIDLLSEVAKRGQIYRLIVPCKRLKRPPNDDLVPIDMPLGVLEVLYYKGHWQALLSNFVNAVYVSLLVQKERSRGRKVVLAGPGPNSFLFWLSFMVSRTAKKRANSKRIY